MKWIPLSMVGIAGAVFLVIADEEPTEGFFPGGASEIDSDAADRAVQAIRKWSDPSHWPGDQDPEAAPYFWDFDVVGRPVFIRVLKNGNRSGLLEVWLEEAESETFELFKTYRVSFFSGELGPKTKQGDLQAPEGFYFISRGRMNPQSSYHLSMDIGYPNAYDRHHGRTGSLLMIHGKSVSLGCFAMTDASIEQIYTLVDGALKRGQPFVRVHCFPFAMTPENLGQHGESEYADFWANLKEGWDWFEEHRRPPNVEVEEGRYVFSGD